MNKYRDLAVACKCFPHIEVPEVRERVDMREVDRTTQKLQNFIFHGTDIPDLANYPKRPKTQF